MGLDGNSVPSRTDIIRRSSWRLNSSDTSKSSRGGTISTTTKQQNEENNTAATERNQANWTVCSLTNESLVTGKRMVACGMGKLYLRASIIEFLAPVDTERFNTRTRMKLRRTGLFDHLKSLHDVFDIHPSRNNSSTSSSTTTTAKKDEENPLFYCTFTGLTPKTHEFIAIRSCGHVYSLRALELLPKEQQQKQNECLICKKPFKTDSDVVILNPLTEETKQKNRVALSLHNSRNLESKKELKRNHAPCASCSSLKKDEELPELKRKKEVSSQKQTILKPGI